MSRVLPIPLFLILLVFSPIAGCDRGVITPTEPSDAETKSMPSFHTTSGSSLSPESDQAQDLRNFLRRKHKIPYGKVLWGKLKIMKMRFEGSQKLVDVVVAPLQEGVLSTSPISVPSKDGEAEKLKIDHSQLVYLPSRNKGFTTEWHFEPSEREVSARRNGFVRFQMSGEQFTYKVTDGWPVKQVSPSPSLNLPRQKNDCLDGPNCSTGDCYKTAKEACESDSGCRLLCDVLDVAGGSCSLSVAAACFYLNGLE